MEYKGAIINNLRAVGTLTAKEQKTQFGNAQYSINTSEDVVIKNCTFGLNGYNCLEIGLAAGITPPKSVTIENCDFSGILSNNAICIFGTQDNAVINIKNCHFHQISNLLRLSNRTNATGVVVNIEDCTVDAYEEYLQWRGLFLFENYTDKTQEAVDENNRFGPDKITMNIRNVKVLRDDEYVNIYTEDILDVTNTAAEDQLFIWCQDYISGAGYIPEAEPSMLPTVYLDDIEINAEGPSGGFEDPMVEEEGD